MSTIIAGRVETQAHADAIEQHVIAHGVRSDHVQVFFTPSAGQHATYPIGGDVYADAGAKPASRGWVVGALVGVIVGTAAGALWAAVSSFNPWLTVTSLAAVGAHVGGLGGALAKTRDKRSAKRSDTPAAEPPGTTRAAGMMVAVNADGHDVGSIIELLKRHGAMGVEKTSGQWRQGQWEDYDARDRPHMVTQ